MKEIKVSILCLTYNHAKYLRQTLDSFLIQKTNFKFEVLINDDASSDGTVEILKEYKKRYPDIIKPVFQKENQYSKGLRNFMVRFLIPNAKGEYLALCEGDDYWTDVNKLQSQVDFLERNKEYSLCFHPVRVVYENKEAKNEIFPARKSGFTIEKLLESNFIQTNSVMYRKQKYRDVQTDLMPTDWYLHLYHARYGKIGYIDKVMATYRKHEAGLWSNTRNDPELFWSRFGRMHLAFYMHVRELYEETPEYKNIIESNITGMVSKIIEESSKSKEIIMGIATEFPAFTSIVLPWYAKQIKELIAKTHELARTTHEVQTALDAKQKEIDDIKSSRVWKVRNSLASIVGKRRI